MSNKATHIDTSTPEGNRLVDIESWLRVYITPTMLFVHRSLQLDVTDEEYGVVRNLVGDAEPLLRAVVPDAGMFLGQAEHLLYTLSEE